MFVAFCFYYPCIRAMTAIKYFSHLSSKFRFIAYNNLHVLTESVPLSCQIWQNASIDNLHDKPNASYHHYTLAINMKILSLFRMGFVTNITSI